MYTYIYTEKPMEFYKEGRVLTIAPSTILDLGAAQYNHKGVIITTFNPSTSIAVGLKFYTKGTKSTQAVFIAASAAGGDVLTTNFTNNLTPVRLAEIDNQDATFSLRVILFN